MKRFLLLCIFIFVLTSGCSYKVSKSDTKVIPKSSNTVSDNSEAKSEEKDTISDNSEAESKEVNIVSDIPGLNPKLKNIIVGSSTPGHYVNNMQFTYNDLSTILNYAKNYGIINPYIPTEGVGCDRILDITKETNALRIGYYNFAIDEALKPIPPPNNKISKERSVKLSIGDGVWRETEGNLPELCLHINDVYIVIFSARYFNEKGYEKIAESMVHIKN